MAIALLLYIIGFAVLAGPVWSGLSRLRKQARAFKNIPGPPRTSWLTGNLTQVFDPNCMEFLKELAVDYPSVSVLQGFCGDKQLHVYDPLALQNIFLREQEIYGKRELDLVLFDLIMGKGVGTTHGEHHRKQRKALNPVFAVNRMRELLPIFYEIEYTLRDGMTAEVKRSKDGAVIDILSWTTRTALEIVGQAGLGYSFEAKGSKSPIYARALKDVFPSLMNLAVPQLLLTRLVRIGGRRFRRFVVDLLSPWKSLTRAKECIDTLDDMSNEIMNKHIDTFRNGDADADQVGRGIDMISTLLKTSRAAKANEEKLPESEILAQIATFILAGVDTTSSALARIFHDLAMRQDVQERLRTEIIEGWVRIRDQRGDDAEMTFDELAALPYLDAVVRESMRLSAPAPFVSRCTKEDVIMPLSQPFKGLDGNTVTEIFVPKDTNIVTGLMACNTNAELWGSDAQEYKPDRWLNGLPKPIMDSKLPGIYPNLMTFGGGKHGCIGFQFSQMEIKVVMTVLMTHFKFELAEKKNIIWRITTGASPTVEGSDVPQLPLKVSLVNSDEY